MATYTEHTVEARRLLVNEVEGHDLQRQQPADLVFRTGSADSAKQIRFVAHDGERYQDVAFITKDRFTAVEVETPSVSFRDRDGVAVSRIAVGKQAKEDEESGSILFTVNDGLADVSVMTLDKRSATIPTIVSDAISVGGTVDCSRLDVASSGHTVADFSTLHAEGSVTIFKDDDALCLRAPRVQALHVSVSSANVTSLFADSVKADDLIATSVSLGDWLIDTDDADLTICTNGSGSLSTDTIDVDSLNARRVHASHLSVTPTISAEFAVFDSASIRRSACGGVAWSGDVITDSLTSESGVLNVNARAVKVGTWWLESTETEWRLRNEAEGSGGNQCIHIDSQCTRIRGLRLQDEAAHVAELRTEYHGAERIEAEDAQMHCARIHELTSDVAELNTVRARTITSQRLNADLISGLAMEVHSESLLITGAMTAHAIICTEVDVDAVTVRAGACDALKVTALTAAALCVNDSDFTTKDGRVGVCTSTPQAAFDVNGDCVVRGVLHLGAHALTHDGDFLDIGRVRVNARGPIGTISVNTQASDAALNLGSAKGEKLIAFHSEGTCAAVELNDCLEIRCEEGVSVEPSLRSEMLRCGQLELSGNVIANALRVQRRDGVDVLHADANGLGVNVSAADAALHVRSEMRNAFAFECHGEALHGLLDGGLNVTCAGFTWATPTVTSSLSGRALSVSGNIHAYEVGSHLCTSAQMSAGGITAGTIFAEALRLGPTAFTTHHGTTRLTETRGLTVADDGASSDVSLTCSEAPCISLRVGDSRHGLAVEDEKLCVKCNDGVIIRHGVNESTFSVPLVAPTVRTETLVAPTVSASTLTASSVAADLLTASRVDADALVLNGFDGARIALDYGQIDALSRMSQFVRVEGGEEIAFEEESLAGIIPSEILDALGGSERTDAPSTERGAARSFGRSRTPDMVVLADSVRVDANRLLSSVPVVATRGLDANNTRLTNIADPTDPQDAVTLSFLASYVPTVTHSGSTNAPLPPLSISGLLGPHSTSPLTVVTDETVVGSLTSSTSSARVTISSQSDAFIVAGDDASSVAFGYSGARGEFAVAGGSSLNSDVWMSLREVRPAGGVAYSEARFGGHVNLRNPQPLLTLTDTSVAETHVLQLAPYTLHLGDASASRGAVGIQNVGHQMNVSVDNHTSMLVSRFGTSVSSLYTTNVDLQGVSIGTSLSCDVILTKGDGAVYSNLGLHHMFNVGYDGSAFVFQDDGYGLVQSFNKETCELQYRFSSVANNSGNGVALHVGPRPPFSVHSAGVCVNTRGRGLHGLQVNGLLVIENESTSQLEARVACNASGSLVLTTANSVLDFTDASGEATIVCNRLSVGTFQDAFSTPGMTAANATIGTCITQTHTSGTTASSFSQAHRAHVYQLSVHDLYVDGTMTAIDVETIRVPDVLIQLAVGNDRDVTDTGVVSHYTDLHGPQIAGITRDASTKRFKIFDSLPKSQVPVDASGHIEIAPSMLRLAGLDVGDLSVGGSVTSLTASAGHADFSHISARRIASELHISTRAIDSGTLSTGSVLSDAISTGPLYVAEIVIGNWKIRNNRVLTRQTESDGSPIFRDELVFLHETTNERNAFRIRQPEA